MGGDRVPGPFDDAVDEETRRRRELIKRHLTGEDITRDLDKLLLRARASWLSEFGRLDDVALDVFHGHPGGFIRRYADAWLHADAWNKRLMRPVWEAFIRKYDLEEDPTGTAVSKVREDP